MLAECKPTLVPCDGFPTLSLSLPPLAPAARPQFVRAVMGRWPNAVLQFEDFNIEHALPLLERYRYHHTVFNDDVQVSLGGG